MRDIKFRAWDKTTEAWMNEDAITIDGNGKVFVFHNYYSQNDNIEINLYTGLKDKNGKDVYEGDICKYAHDKHSKEYIGGIFYKDDAACFHLKTGDYSSFALLGHQKEIEIVGNIYEGLLNQKQTT